MHVCPETDISRRSAWEFARCRALSRTWVSALLVTISLWSSNGGSKWSFFPQFVFGVSWSVSVINTAASVHIALHLRVYFFVRGGATSCKCSRRSARDIGPLPKIHMFPSRVLPSGAIHFRKLSCRHRLATLKCLSFTTNPFVTDVEFILML